MHKIFIMIFSLFILCYFNNNIYGKFNDISEKSGVAIDSESHAVLYNNNMNKKIYPASTTKILTAIIAIENLNLNSNITITEDDIRQIPAESSLMHFDAGDTLTVKDLLYGLLLTSGNDAAIVIANNLSGSIANFSLLMNKKAKELGALNSNFTNPHGYYSFKHYSTPYDMALIMSYASENKIFREICETKESFLEETSRTLENTNALLGEDLNYTLGGKTGYVDESGNVFISYGIKDNNKIICALYEGTKSKALTFKDTKNIYNTIFSDFSKNTIVKKDDIHISYLDKTTGTNYILSMENDINSMKDNSTSILRYDINTIEIKDNNIIGDININCGNDIWNLTNDYKLITNSKEYSVFENDNNKNIFYLIFITISLLFIILLIRKINKNNKRKKKIIKKINNI